MLSWFLISFHSCWAGFLLVTSFSWNCLLPSLTSAGLCWFCVSSTCFLKKLALSQLLQPRSSSALFTGAKQLKLNESIQKEQSIAFHNMWIRYKVQSLLFLIKLLLGWLKWDHFSHCSSEMPSQGGILAKVKKLQGLICWNISH